MRRIILSSALLFLATAFGCGSNLRWEELSPAEGKFSAQMPGKAVKEITGDADAPFTHYTVELHLVTYSIIYCDLLPGDPGVTLARFRSYWARKKWTVTKVTEFPEDGCIWELEAKMDGERDQYYSGRKFETPTRAYEVKVQGPRATLSNPYVRKFLDSFKVIK